jgi:DHA2 family multidrug resistance protein
LLASLIRRLRSPNPLVDLPYLRQWNTILLAFCLGLFRFCLLATIILIPQSLAIHGFEADQIGPALIWTALPQLLIACIAALLLVYGFDSRLLMASGFLCMAAAALLNAQFTTVWSASNYYRSELLMGVGQSFAFIGLVSTIVLQAIFSGGLAKAQLALTFSAFFHIIRLLGGQIGVAVMTTTSPSANNSTPTCSVSTSSKGPHSPTPASVNSPQASTQNPPACQPQQAAPSA